MLLYVKNKNRKTAYPSLIIALAVGMSVWWWSAQQPVFAQSTGNSIKQISLSASLFNNESRIITNGTYQVRFGIYTRDRVETDPYPSNADTGSRLWEETQEVTVKNGIFRVFLGTVTALPASLNFESGDYFIGMRIGEDSEMVPRKKLGSVPSAINAQFLQGRTTGTGSGNIPVLGNNGKIGIKNLPVGEGDNQLVRGDDSRLGDSHQQNTDTGTDSETFNIGSGTATAGTNFDLTVSSATVAPALRYNGTTQSWQLSNDGGTFADISSGSSSAISGTGTNGYVAYWTGTSSLGAEAQLSVSRGGTGATTLADLITLGTHTTGNYVATITAGNGISGTSSTEGGTPTISLDILTTTDGAGANSSNSGFEFAGGSSNQLAMLQGCSNNQILKWDDSSNVWTCSNDAGGGTAVININEGATAYTGVDTLTFTAADFNISQVATEATVAIDYANSGITRRGSNETISGTWSFSTALGVASGGTGAATFTSNGVLYGNGTGAVQVTTAGTNGQLLLGVSSGAPAFATMSGDATISNAGVLAIAGNAVALTTDTTGNYVQSLSNGNGITGGNGGSEGAALTLAVDLLDSADGAGSASSISGLEFQGSGTNELTLLQGCADSEILAWDDTNTLWECATVNGVGGINGSGSTNHVAYWQDSNTLTSEATLSTTRGGTGAASLADLITLGTHTTGNYVASANTSVLTGLTGGSSGSEAAALTLAFDYSQALSGDVGLAANAAVFGQSGIIFEGSGANTFETFIAVTNATADRTLTIPDVSGTLITTGDTGTVTSAILTDGTIDEVDLNATNGPTAGFILAYDSGGGFTWISNTGGSGASKWTDSGTVTYLTDTADDLAVGGSSSLASRFFFDVTTGNQIIFEGTGANDGSETTLVITNPTADRTITLPNITGSIVTTGDTDTVSGTMITDATIGEVDLNVTNGPTAGYILTYDSGGGFTWISNTGGSGASKWTDSGTVTYLTDTADDVAFGGTSSAASRFFFDVTTGNQIIFEGTGVNDGSETTLVITNPTADRTITIPNADGTVAFGTGTANQVAYWSATNTLTGENQLATSRGGTGASSLTDLIALTTHTTGNYVQSITNGSGISGGNGGSEGAALTLALGALTADWNQTGAFDIQLNNASSELKILESAGATFYGIFDVTDLGADRTYTFPNVSGTVITTGDTGTVTGTMIADGTIEEVDLEVTNSPSAGYVLTYDSGTAGFTWTDSGGLGNSKWTDSGTLTYLSATSDDVAFGGSTTTAARFVFDVQTGNQILFEGTGADDGFETTLVITNPTADRTVTIPNITGTVALLDGGQTFTSALWNGTAIGAQYGGTGLNTSASTGVPSISSGTWSVNTLLPLSLGGTNKNITPSAGSVAYSDGDSFELTAVGNAAECLVSNGTSAPSWTACTSAASSPFNASGGVISKVTASDRLSLLYGDAADTQLTIENTTNAVIPTADIMAMNLSGGTTGIVTDGVDGLYLVTEFGNGTANTNSGIHIDIDPVNTPSGDETFYAINIDGLSAGTSANETAINVGTNWDTILNTAALDISAAGAITGGTGITSSGTITFSGLSAGGVVSAAAGTGVLSVGTLGASSITADSLDFTEFEDTLDLDATLTLNQTTNTWSQTFTGDTTTGLTYTANSLTSGKAFAIASSATAFTGALSEITLSGSNAANTGSLLTLTNSGVANTNTSFVIQHNATGTNNLAFRVNDVASDTTPFVIDGAGNVGVGTDVPGAPLSLGAALGNTKLAFYDSGGALMGFGIQSNQFRMHLVNSSNRFSFLDAPAGNELFTILGTGNTGVGGDITPDALFSVGSTSQFQVNSSGAVAAATGITSSGTITLSGLSAGGVVSAAAGTGVLSVGTLGASSITADSLDFTEFQDTLDLDATLTLNQTTNTWSQTFTGDTTTGLTYTASALTNGTAVSILGTGAGQTSSTLLNVAASGYTTGYTGNVANFTGVSTTGASNVVNITTANTTAGNGLNLTANGITTGVGMNLAHSTSAITTGSLLRVASTATDAFTTGGLASVTSNAAFTTTANTAGLLNVSASGTTAGTLVNIASSAAGQTSSTLLNIVASGYTTGYTGNVANFTGVGTTGAGNVVNITTANTTAGNGLNLTANGITTGVGMNLAHATSAITSGSLIRVASTATDAFTTGGLAVITSNAAFTTTANTAGLLNVAASGTTAGTVVNISSSAAGQTASTLLNVVASGYTTGYTGNVANFTGVSTTGASNVVNVTSANTTAGNAMNITANGLTTGTGLNINSTGVIATTGSLLSLTANSATSPTGLLSITANGLTSGTAAAIASSATAFTGALQTITLSGSNAANTGNLLSLQNTGTANTNTSLLIQHNATGTNNLAFRVNDVASDTTPFVIDGTGAVGIGTTAPSGWLDVSNSGADVVSTITASDATFDPILKYRTGSSPSIQFSLGIDNSDSDKFKIYSGDGLGGGDEFVIDSNGVTTIANLNLGAVSFDTDAGIVSWADLTVTSGASSGTVESYSAQIDGTSFLTIYAQSDGAGGLTTTASAVKADVQLDATADGLATKVVAGNCSDTNFNRDTDGLLCIDSTGGSERLYFREGGAWNYIAKTGGFQIPNYETAPQNKLTNEAEGFLEQNLEDISHYPEYLSSRLEPGELLIPYVDEYLSDGAVHGLYARFADVKDKMFATEKTQIADLTLKTDQNISTLAGLQTSIDAQLALAGAGISSLLESQALADTRLTTLETQVGTVEALAGQIESDMNAVVSQTTLVESQIATLTEQVATLSDFYTAFELGSLVAKDASGNVDLLEGKLKATLLETGGLTIEVVDPDAATIGTAVIIPVASDADSDGTDDETGSDGKSVIVSTNAMIPMVNGSRIFTSFKGNPGGFNWVEKVKNDEDEYIGFKIRVSDPVTDEVKVDWWLVEQKDTAPVTP